MAVRKAFAARAKAGTLKKGSKLSISVRVGRRGRSSRPSGSRSKRFVSRARGAASTFVSRGRATARAEPKKGWTRGLVAVKMGQGAVAPFVFPFAQTFAANQTGPAAMTAATNEAARRLGLELSMPGAPFNIGNIGTQNTPGQPGQGGGLLTTLAQEGMNIAVEQVDKGLGHRAALARGNVFAIVDELIPVLEAGTTTGWRSDPQSLLTDYAVYNQARTGYDPASHSIFAPNQLAYFIPRNTAKLALFLARKFTTGHEGLGRFLNVRHWFKGAS